MQQAEELQARVNGFSVTRQVDKYRRRVMGVTNHAQRVYVRHSRESKVACGKPSLQETSSSHAGLLRRGGQEGEGAGGYCNERELVVSRRDCANERGGDETLGASPQCRPLELMQQPRRRQVGPMISSFSNWSSAL